jgi:ABC-type xylose transport system permease subunit
VPNRLCWKECCDWTNWRHPGSGSERWPFFGMGVGSVLIVGALVGLVNGLFIAYLKLPPFVVTLAMMSMARALTLVVRNNQVVYDLVRQARRCWQTAEGRVAGGSRAALRKHLRGIIRKGTCRPRCHPD